MESEKNSASKPSEEVFFLRLSLKGRVEEKRLFEMTESELKAEYEKLRSETDAERAKRSEKQRSEAANEVKSLAEQRRVERLERLRLKMIEMGERAEEWTEEQINERAAEITREREGRERQRRQRARAESLFARAGCPERHVRNLDSLDSNEKGWIETHDLLAERLGEGFLVALLGKRGTGKTQMAITIIHKACQRGMSCHYIKALDLFRRVRATYVQAEKGDAGEREEDVIDTYAALDLLVIDEAHQRAGSEFEQNLVTNLIDRRYDAMKDTIVIANESKAQFAESMGLSIVSRIHETGDAIECDWASYRKPGSWNRNDEPEVE